MSKRSEEHLFEAIQDGDERAFERVFELYQERVRLVAWRISHRPDWVEEIVHEAWCRAFAARRQYDSASPFLVWMAGILRNVYREECRKSPRIAVAESTGQEQAPDASPEAVAAEAELLSGLNDCTNQLDKADAEVVRLRFMRGLPLRQCAAELGIAESTLRDVRIPAILKRLRKCMESKGLEISHVFPAQEAGQDQ